MNIFKRLFNWVQSAPADFCYVTGEWGFQRRTGLKPATASKAFQSTNKHRSPVVFPTAPAGKVAAARVAAFADFPVTDLLIHSANAAQEQNAFSQTVR
ncbi:MAG TPA: hypothetical protein VHA33_28115 [Candidatus Angelobacter sp.]|jgi:hypothetical protein|nr:hypothetical protein [Candidatus Angelobacter sp.]